MEWSVAQWMCLYCVTRDLLSQSVLTVSAVGGHGHGMVVAQSLSSRDASGHDLVLA